VLLCQPQDKPAGTQYKALSEVLASTPLAEAEKFDSADCMETFWMSYSSGTTGLPKGVMTSHWNMTSQLQASNVTFTQLESGKDVVIGFLPMSHIYGVTLSLFQPISFGCAVVILPRFEEASVLTAMQRYRVTVALLVPPLVLTFVQSKNLDKYDLSTVRVIMSGAAPLSPELSAAFMKRLPNSVIVQGYGMTETTPNICTMNRDEAIGREGWVGRLCPTYQARLVREDGSDCDADAGESGELWVRGPSVMKGYHANPTATVGAMAPGGWFRTGDVLVRDNKGWYKVVDRIKELIKYKGYQGWSKESDCC
jgi:acyl-CoA synthetase (AMP-forming)/AMP-acid ligase II